MEEVSIILKNHLLLTIEEFRVLENYSYTGQVWTLIQKSTDSSPLTIKHRRIEYIFDPESLTIFGLVSRNILAQWDTNLTRNLGPHDEFWLTDSMCIRPCVGRYI